MPTNCTTCGEPTSWAGILCLEPLPWEPSRNRAQCRQCIEGWVAFQGEMRVIAEDLQDRADHLHQCSFCWGRRGLMPPLALTLACSLNTKEREKQRKVVAA